MEKGQRYIWFVFILLAFIWGSSFILMKRAIVHFSLWQVATIRLMSAMMILLPIAFIHFKKIKKHEFKYVFLSGLCGMFLPAFLFAAGQQHLNSATVGVLNALTPSATFIMGIVFFRQYFKAQLFYPIVFGLMGTVLLILTNSKGEFTINGAVFLIMLATFGYGTNTNVIKTYIPNMSSLALSSISVSFVGTLAAFVFFGFTDWKNIAWQIPEVRNSFAAAVALGIFGTGIAQLLFNSVLRLSTAVMASTVTYLMPVIAVAWGLLDGERFTLMHVIGMLIIFFSVLWIGRINFKKS